MRIVHLLSGVILSVLTMIAVNMVNILLMFNCRVWLFIYLFDCCLRNLLLTYFFFLLSFRRALIHYYCLECVLGNCWLIVLINTLHTNTEKISLFYLLI